MNSEGCERRRRGQRFRDGSYGTRRRRRTAKRCARCGSSLTFSLALLYTAPLPPRAIPRRGSFLGPVFSRHYSRSRSSRSRPPADNVSHARHRAVGRRRRRCRVDSISVRPLVPSVCPSLFLLRRSRAAILALLRPSVSLPRTRENTAVSLRFGCAVPACLSSSRALSFSLSLSPSLSVALRYTTSLVVAPTVPLFGLLVAHTWQASALHFAALLSHAASHNHEARRTVVRSRTVLSVRLSLSLYLSHVVVVVVSALDGARTQQKIILLVVAVVAVADVLVVVVGVLAFNARNRHSVRLALLCLSFSLSFPGPVAD